MKIINTKKAPGAIGPYVQALVAGDFLYVSGQLPVNPENGEIDGTDIKSQTRRSLSNLKNIIEEAGSSMDKVVRCTVFLKDLTMFNDMNEVYADSFGGWKPTRSCYQVAKLPRDVLVEIDAIVYLKK